MRPVDVKRAQIVPGDHRNPRRARLTTGNHRRGSVRAGRVQTRLQDRFTLPDAGLYEVIGIDDHNYGFHQWPPGSVVKLKRVTG